MLILSLEKVLIMAEMGLAEQQMGRCFLWLEDFFLVEERF
jgi:hypothetical protein